MYVIKTLPSVCYIIALRKLNVVVIVATAVVIIIVSGCLESSSDHFCPFSII
jgi:hypothetical protein